MWQLIDGIHGIGWVTAHKLLAHKRPALLPFYDRVVKAALQPHDEAFWLPLHEALHGEAGAARLAQIQALRTEARLPPWVSELRVLDVVVWMNQPGPASATLTCAGSAISRGLGCDGVRDT